MMPFSNLTLRNVLIATHDARATTLAVLASFYLRFEGDAFFDRLPLLLRILPYFVIFSVVVCYAFNLTTTKWRFISLPDALNILRVATVLALGLVVLDYVFVAPKFTAGRWRQMFRARSFSAKPRSFSTGAARPPLIYGAAAISTC